MLSRADGGAMPFSWNTTYMDTVLQPGCCSFLDTADAAIFIRFHVVLSVEFVATGRLQASPLPLRTAPERVLLLIEWIKSVLLDKSRHE